MAYLLMSILLPFNNTSYIREAFQTKKRGNLGNVPDMGGGQKIKKVPSFSWKKFKIRGEVFGNQKSPRVFQRRIK